MKCSKRIDLPEIVDPRGGLIFAEDDRHIPFKIKRIFCIYQVPAEARRGAHAHRNHHQFIMMLHGASTVSIDEGTEIADVRLEHPSQGLYIPPLVWIELTKFTEGAVCLVLTSEHFDESDYIRDYAEFRSITLSRRC